jgi:hypothetical protein
MSHELICSWLGLEPGEWPPDHYRLLALPRGEDNLQLIEQRVHERLDTVRRYQMMHPEQATEAMNRLAQAFVCLTEPSAKRAYDTEVLGLSVPQPATATAEAPHPDRDPLAWLYSALTAGGPKTPAPRSLDTPVPRSLIAPRPSGAAVPPPLPVVPPPLPELAAPESEQGPAPKAPEPEPEPKEPVDPLVEAAESRLARRGLIGRRALYRRIARTRQLIHSWNGVGKATAAPKRRLIRLSEIRALQQALEKVQQQLKDFPPLLGEAGQPGYLLFTTGLLEVSEIQALSPQQRDALARDWKNGLKLLTAHRDFLRKEVKQQRGWSVQERTVRFLKALFSDQPAVALVLLALLALNIAVWRYGQFLWNSPPHRSAPADTRP